MQLPTGLFKSDQLSFLDLNYQHYESDIFNHATPLRWWEANPTIAFECSNADKLIEEDCLAEADEVWSYIGFQINLERLGIDKWQVKSIDCHPPNMLEDADG